MSIFFFQAEDGIRDVAVTGVQTCALPISTRGKVRCSDYRKWSGRVRGGDQGGRTWPESGCRGEGPVPGRDLLTRRVHPHRSEEHTSELQSRLHLRCRLLPEKKRIDTRTSF